jgi:hypothetical protein
MAQFLIDHFGDLITVVIVLGNLAVGGMMLFMRSNFVSKAKFWERDEGMQKAVAALTSRVTAVEAHIPAAQRVQAVELAMTRLEGLLGTLGQQVKGLDGLVDRVDKTLVRHEQYIRDLRG